MRRTTLLLSVAVLSLASGCATDPGEGRFLINGRSSVVPQHRLAQLRAAWSADSAAVLAPTRSGELQWTMDFIANVEAQATSACTSLRAVKLQELPLKAFRFFDGVQQQVQDLAPAKYHESWLVETCGKPHVWRILDDSAHRGSHTVLLWSRG